MEELDSLGEYYVDRDTNILYFYPPQSSGKVTLTLVAPAFLNMLGVNNVEIKAISFEGSRQHGIYLNKCDNITIENCIVDKVQKVGIFGESQCTNITLAGNHIKNAGTTAINLVGGDFLKDMPSGNVIINNWIHDFGRVQKTYCYGVMVRGYKTRVAHNKIHDCPHTALGFSGNDHVIEYNEIFNALKNTDDMGAIYTGRTKLDQGTVIRHNYIHDLITDSTNSAGIFGIYLDDMQDGITIESNVFENIQGSAVFINGGRVNKVDSNVVINAGEANFRISLAGLNLWGGDINRLINEFPGMNDGTYKSEPYKKYEHLAEIMEDEPLYAKYNEITNNVSVGTANDIFYDLWGRQDKQVVIDRNTINVTHQYKKDPGFENFERGNYTINENSELASWKALVPPTLRKWDF